MGEVGDSVESLDVISNCHHSKLAGQMTPTFSYPALRLRPLLAFSELVTSEDTQAWTLLCKQNLGSLGSCHSLEVSPLLSAWEWRSWQSLCGNRSGGCA